MRVARQGSDRPVLAAAIPMFLLLASLASVSACGGEAPQDEAVTDEAAAPADEAATPTENVVVPRVFFIEPAGGETTESPVQFKFGAENFVIEPVGEGEIHEGAGHMHIGIDTDCLAPGIVIPQASPWIHFGDGSMEIELQLEPGTHRLCLQVGDGEHRTLDDEGMSDEITFSVR